MKQKEKQYKKQAATVFANTLLRFTLRIRLSI